MDTPIAILMAATMVILWLFITEDQNPPPRF